MKRAFFSASVFAVALSLGPRAFAQEAPAPAPATPAPAATAVIAPPSAAVVVTTAPKPEPKKDEKKEEEKKQEKDSAHFRFGMGLDGALIYSSGADGILGGGAGLQLRLGAQINSWFATYYQPHAIAAAIISAGSAVGVSGSGVTGGPSGKFVGMVFNSVLAEATLPVLHIGAGPSADIIGIQGVALPGEPTAGNTSAYFGVDGRVAIVIGGHGPGSHVGFEIEGNAHPTFFQGSVLTTLSVGIGGELY